MLKLLLTSQNGNYANSADFLLQKNESPIMVAGAAEFNILIGRKVSRLR